MIFKPLINVTVDESTREERLRELLGRTPDPGTSPSTGGFSLERLADRYVFHNMGEPFSSGQYTLEMSRVLLDSGNNHVLSEWVKTPSLRTIGGKTFGLLSCPDYFSIMLALEEHQNDPRHEAMIQEVKELLLSDFKLPRYMTTDTVVRYVRGQAVGGIVGALRKRTSGVDVAIHHYGSPRPRLEERQEQLVGPDVFVESGKGQENGLYALTGVRDLNKLIHAVEFVTGKKPYWYRLNSAPSADEERALVLGVTDDVRFNINADVINCNRPVRGVVVRKKF